MCQSKKILLSLVSHRPAGVDRQKEMVELTVAGLFPLQAQDQIDDDFREGLLWEYE